MKPEHVKFHVDAGAFRGIVFVKYRYDTHSEVSIT
jgi:hypothetical protein